MKILTFFLFLCTSLAFGQGQKKEVFIIGTMHTLPKIVKNSYKPLLKMALKYQPEAIYVESPMPEDNISWEYLKNGWSNAYKKLYQLSDSLKRNYHFEARTVERLQQKKFEDLSPADLTILINSFAYLRDNANYELYSYLKKYGVKGAKKPLRNEDEDLSYKLALQLGIGRLFNMDDQQTNKEYHAAWQACVKLGAKNGDNELNNKLNRKDYKRSIVPALLGRLGRHTNSKAALERMHQLNSFSYVLNQNEPCALATKYWNERNYRMAKNIVTQVAKNPYVKNVVVVGAGHVVGLKAAIMQQDPNVVVKLIDP
ncbi:DUF5694 domain-containing protein [Pedobacter sp. UC225_65]|uniref:DUF5694 domain-containing protein n=1 Tax=Pedobacter sp. UC225_65 TaxID=3350173 RepID=UPI00367272D2